MKTKIRKVGDTVIVEMTGKLDYEAQVPLRERLITLVDKSKTDTVPKNIIFNFENLEFVGSSGISSFVQTLREVNTTAPIRPRYCNVRSEFQRIIRAFDNDEIFDFFDDEDSARKSFGNC